MDDKIDINFDKPVFIEGEMPTAGKLNTIANKFEQASDQILRATGNTFLRNICNIAAVLGNAGLLSDPGSIIPATPAIFDTGNKLLNKLEVTVGSYDGGKYLLSMNSSTYLLGGENVVFTDKVINIALAAFSISQEVIVRAYEGSFTPPAGTTAGQDITSLYFTPGTNEALFGSDISNPDYQMVILAPNQTVIGSLMQALVNIGSLAYPSRTLGFIADTSGTLETYTAPKSVTEEITFLENKYFYANWKVVIRKGDGVVPNPAWKGTDVSVGLSQAWNTSTWIASSCSPSPTNIIEFLSRGAIIPPVQGTDTTCYAKNATDIAQEISSPNILRARVYTNAGIPLMRSDGVQVFACFEASGHGSLPTVYIASEDQGSISASDYFTIMIPVAIPMRLMRAEDFMVNSMINLWPSMMTNVIGSSYYGTPAPLAIDVRLQQAEANMNLLADAINDLTTQNVTLT
jgi:hypothetical protein